MSSTGNAIHGNVVTAGLITATGNIIGGNLNATGLSLSGNVVSALNVTANVTGGNLLTPGLISAAGNIYAATLGANINFANNTASFSSFRGYSLITNARGSISGAQTIDISLGNYVTVTAAGSITWTFSNPIASPNATGFVLVLTNGGLYTMTWPANTKWPNGSAPTLTSSGVDVLVFITNDGGTTWRGVVSMSNSS